MCRDAYMDFRMRKCGGYDMTMVKVLVYVHLPVV